MEKSAKLTGGSLAPVWTVADLPNPQVTIASVIAFPVSWFSSELQPVQKPHSMLKTEMLCKTNSM